MASIKSALAPILFALAMLGFGYAWGAFDHRWESSAQGFRQGFGAGRAMQLHCVEVKGTPKDYPGCK